MSRLPVAGFQHISSNTTSVKNTTTTDNNGLNGSNGNKRMGTYTNADAGQQDIEMTGMSCDEKKTLLSHDREVLTEGQYISFVTLSVSNNL